MRSERNIIADGLTRWSQGELEDWVSQEGMAEVVASSLLWAGMALSYNPDIDVGPPLKRLRYLATFYTFPGPTITACVIGAQVIFL